MLSALEIVREGLVGVEPSRGEPAPSPRGVRAFKYLGTLYPSFLSDCRPLEELGHVTELVDMPSSGEPAAPDAAVALDSLGVGGRGAEQCKSSEGVGAIFKSNNEEGVTSFVLA